MNSQPTTTQDRYMWWLSYRMMVAYSWDAGHIHSSVWLVNLSLQQMVNIFLLLLGVPVSPMCFLLFILLKITSIVSVRFVSLLLPFNPSLPYNHTTNPYVYTPQRVGGVVCTSIFISTRGRLKH